VREPFSYDAIADGYARGVDDAPYNALYERPATLALLPPVAGAHVLDVGCGNGWYAERLLALGAAVTAIDGSAAMAAHARALADAGFAVERLVEPVPTAAFRAVRPEAFARLLRRPGFLLIRARPWPLASG
jgi:SAM-dependent methyltransferase